MPQEEGAEAPYLDHAEDLALPRMPRVERRGGDHLADIIPDQLGPELKDEALEALSEYLPYE